MLNIKKIINFSKSAALLTITPTATFVNPKVYILKTKKSNELFRSIKEAQIKFCLMQDPVANVT